MGVKYNPANIGDILKHSWLIEVVCQLSNIAPSSLFLYADTFCGFKDYSIDLFFKERQQENFFDTPLYRIQEPHLQKDRYLGSVGIVKELLGDRLRADVFDRKIHAMSSHDNSSTRLLELQSGYDILQRMINYDLILLDPYDDFLEEYKKVIREISWKIVESSVLLFVPYLKESQFQDVKAFTRFLQVDFTARGCKKC